MHIALSLVGMIFLGMQCYSRAVPSENDRQYHVETFYQPTERRNLKQERSLQQVPRAANYQQGRETNQPEQTQYETVYVKNEGPSRPKRGKKLPKVEQYLKEVTPTTNTAFNPAIYKSETQLLPLYEQYVKESSKPVPIAQNILAIQNAILARENAIYEQRRADQLQKQIGAKYHSDPLENFEISKPDEDFGYYQNEQNDQNEQHGPYENDADDEAEEEGDDEPEPEDKQPEPEYEEKITPIQKSEKKKEPSPDREIVYYHNVEYERETGSKSSHPPAPEKKKQQEEAPEEEDEEDDDEGPEDEEAPYHNQKEEYDPESEKENYGEKEPAPPNYQAKLPKLVLPTEAGLEHLYEPVTPNSAVYPEERQSPKKPKEQIYVSDVKFEKNVVYKPGQPKEEVSYYVDPRVVQYHLEEAGTTNYITDQNKGYRPQTANQQIPTEQSYQKYKTNVAKYHQVPASQSSKPRGRVITHYVLVPQPVSASNHQESYQPQQYAHPQPQQKAQSPQGRPSYLGPSDEEYQQSQLKQKLGRNSSLRILKTGKPVVFIGHEE